MNYATILYVLLTIIYLIIIFLYVGDDPVAGGLGFCTSQSGFNSIYISTCILGTLCLILTSIIYALGTTHIPLSFGLLIITLSMNFAILVLNFLVIFPKYGPLGVVDPDATTILSATDQNPITQCWMPRTLPIIIFTALNFVILGVFYKCCTAHHHSSE